MYLHNPKNGSIIKDIWIYDVLYFDSKKGEQFNPSDVIMIEDRPGAYLNGLYEFLENVTPTQAKTIQDENDKEKFPCDVCGFVSKSPGGLDVHKHKMHTVAEGIRSVSGAPKSVVGRNGDIDNQSGIDSEASRNGLIGEGLTVEHLGSQMKQI